MIKRTFEFDSFGPWVIEISGRHRLPPLFVRFEHQCAEALMLFKIPRNIERRKANPDMNLYDMVVGAFPTFIMLLKRTGDNVTRLDIPLSSITYISNTECLLAGNIAFFTKNKTININYNTVSHEVISKFLNLIRELLPTAERSLELDELTCKPDDIEILYYNLLQDIKRKDRDSKLIAYQPNFKLVPGSSGLKRIVSRLFSPENFLSAVFITNSREMIIIDRSTTVQGKKDSRYAYTFTYIPLQSIIRINTDNSPEYPDVKRLIIKLQSHSFTFLLNSKSHGIKSLTRSFTF